MRIWEKAVSRWDEEQQRYVLVATESESFEYCGDVALCDRSQAQRFANQDQNQATTSAAAVNSNLQNYDRNLQQYLNQGRQTYGTAGDYMKSMNSIGNTVASAGAKTLGTNLALNKMRTGENTAGYAGTVAETGRETGRDLTGFLADANANRMQQLNNVNQFGVSASALPAQIQAQIYGSSLGNATQNAQMPSGWDMFMNDAIGAAGTAASGFLGGYGKGMSGGGGGGGCWVAAELYGGWYQPRTVLVREWLNAEFTTRPIGRAVMAIYHRTGKCVASLLRRFPQLKFMFFPMFNAALRKALAHKEASRAH
jgi:hypothetical protein